MSNKTENGKGAPVIWIFLFGLFIFLLIAAAVYFALLLASETGISFVMNLL